MKLNVLKEYKKSFEVKTEWWEFSSWSEYLGSIPIKILAAFVSGRKSELQAIDRKTRKLVTTYGALNSASDFDRLYIP